MGLFNRGNKNETGAGAAQSAIDPVCGMKVNVGQAAATSVHEGKTYYFCNPGCKKTFDAAPAKYTRGAAAAKPSGHHHMM